LGLRLNGFKITERFLQNQGEEHARELREKTRKVFCRDWTNRANQIAHHPR